MKPVVVDTSVHISSEVFASAGSPAKEVLARGFDRHFEFVTSDALIEEITRTLVSSGAPADDVAEYVGRLMAVARDLGDVDIAGVECDDPDDRFVVALARAAEAWCVVAYDDALLGDDRVPSGWKPGPFLFKLREERGEPRDQRYP